MSSARSEANPGAKLLEAARELFYEQGYAAAGINEVIAKSQTSKKSFYNYFPSKKELGEACLLTERDELLGFLDRLMRRYPSDFKGFITAWTGSIKRSLSANKYNGCPFANWSAQAPGEFRKPLRKIIQKLIAKLEEYLQKCDLRLTPERSTEAAHGLLMQYYGAIQMWKFTTNESCFDSMMKNIFTLIDPPIPVAHQNR